MLGALLQLHSSAADRNTNASYHAVLAVLSRVGCNWVCNLFVRRTPPSPGERLTAVVIVIVPAQIH